jgi:pimeloyl-ACP methyl ester carboxylesterase
MLPRWSEIEVPVTVVQGEKDSLVSPLNADFAERVLVNAPVVVDRIPDANHFTPWTHRERIRKAILDQLEELDRHDEPLPAGR